MSTISARYPEYQATAHLDELRATEYSYLDSQDHVYLDYTGSGLAASAQIRHHNERLTHNLYGNPHSSNPTSAAATEAMDRARARILAHLNASPDEYTVIFTANATGAARLVGEAYPFSRHTRLVLTADNHNSINGIREFARARGARTTYIPLQQPSLRTTTADVLVALPTKPKRTLLDRLTPTCRSRRTPSPSTPPQPLGLLAYPAQSNFTGVRHPLSWVHLAQQRGYHVLLDAAAYLPTALLDLSGTKPGEEEEEDGTLACQPDFVTISWYKVFGYPTGVGCLVARRAALEVLRAGRPWFAGGTVQAAMAGVTRGDWFMLAGGAEGFEDGTGNFLGVPDVAFGVRCLTGWFLERLGALRHGDGRAIGGTVAFNFLDAEGKVVDERIVAMESAAARISLRTGCFCNPGAAQAALGLDVKTVRKLAGTKQLSGGLDELVGLLGIPSLGAIRVSFGLASTAADVDMFIGFAEKTYKDRVITDVGLPRRTQC
ncbi:pyridoxal phosphate-dependent transferase [Chaetomium sp. MPI-CAGE-AT-0009]|nr:pyridoxal phosphate-dependent transferase [Chaetomium sp. MPI-CAGE-AT-0009]